MKNPTDHISEIARTIRLSDEAKNGIRANLLAHMHAHPASEAVPSPYLSYFAPYTSFTFGRAPAFALALILVLAVGGGTAYASEGALPGDALYPVKVGIIELARKILAMTSQTKAEVSISIALTRLHEAEQLSAQSRLTASSSAELQQRFDESLAEAFVHLIDLQQENPDAAISEKDDLNLSLGVHAAVLDDLKSSTSTIDVSGRAALAEHLRIAFEKSHDATSSETVFGARAARIRHEEVKILSTFGFTISERASSTPEGDVDSNQQRDSNDSREKKGDSTPHIGPDQKSPTTSPDSSDSFDPTRMRESDHRALQHEESVPPIFNLPITAPSVTGGASTGVGL